MTNLHGASLCYPVRVNQTSGALGVATDKHDLIRQAIEDILETRKTN